MTMDDLHDGLVFVQNESICVGTPGTRLKRTLKTLVLGWPIHSHKVKRTVQSAVGLNHRLNHRFASHEAPHRVSGKVVAVANGIQPEKRLAVLAFEPSKCNGLGS